MIDIYIQKIPLELKPELIKTIERVERSKLRAQKEDIKKLFEIYKTYLAPHDKQDIGWRACRAKVCGVFFQILRAWRTNNKQN